MISAVCTKGYGIPALCRIFWPRKPKNRVGIR